MRQADYPNNGLFIDNKVNEYPKDAGSGLFCRATVENISPHAGSKVARYGRAKEGVIKLDVGEGDVPTPDVIVKAAQKAMNEGDMFYGPVLGTDELRSSLSSYYQRIYNHDIPASRFFVTPSGTAAVHYALTTIIDAGDEVVAVTPLWRNLLGAIELQGGVIKEVGLDIDDQNWHLDVQKIFDAVSDKTRAIIINSPNNPTGWMISKAQMQVILDFARQRGIWIVSDEVYSRLVLDDSRPAPSFLDVSEPEDLLLVVNSFSKNWSMTGWRLGWVVGPERISERFYNVALYSAMGPSPFIQKGGIAALEKGEDFVRELRDTAQKGRDYVYQRFADIGDIISAKPSATYYSFFKPNSVPCCVNFATKLIDEQDLLLAPGSAFSSFTAGYLRLCFAVPLPKLEDGMNRLEKALKTL